MNVFYRIHLDVWGGELTIVCGSVIKSDVCRFSHSKVEEKHKAIAARNTQS